MIKRVALHSRPFDQSKVPYISQIFEELERFDTEIFVSETLKNALETINLKVKFAGYFTSYKDMKNMDLFVGIGGDGTLLEAVSYIRDGNVPILGINTGRLGFLASMPRDKIKFGIDDIFEGNYKLEERILLQINDEKNIFGDFNFGLNEVAIAKKDSASMITVHAYLDGEYLNSYWADGLIISTPTGSTAYSLSVGGPVMMPQCRNFAISPISPHNLNVRPLVVPDTCKISLEIEGRHPNFLVSVDSRFQAVENNTLITVQRCDFTVQLVRLKNESFLHTLRQKLNWGLDNRN